MLVTIVCVLFGALLAVNVAGLGGPLWVAVGIGVAGVLILFHEHHDRSPGRRGSRD